MRPDLAPDLATFAVAQTCSIKGGIVANVARHVALANEAARHGARLILFPELSLTGYEPALVAALALHADDAQLAPLRDAAMARNIAIVVGAPLATAGDKPRIAALSFLPSGAIQVYTKAHLHPGEETAFSVGSGGAGLALAGAPVALAVCAEISQASHAAAAAQSGAALYAASMLVSENGYAHDAGLLRGYAREHRMPVAMANHGGDTGGWALAGRSAVWDEEGQPVVAAAGTGECLLLARRTSGVWHGEIAASAD